MAKKKPAKPDPCRWCEPPSITNHNPERIFWAAEDMASNVWIACTFHLGNAVEAAHMNNLDAELPVKVYAGGL